MRRASMFRASLAFAFVGLPALVLPAVAWAQYDGPMGGGPGYGGPGYGGPMYGGPAYGGPGYGGPEGPGGYGPGYGPPRGMAYGYPGPGYRRAAHSSKTRGSVAYHGYRIGLTSSPRSAQGARQAAAIEHQVDIVNHAGLSAADLRLFRSKLIHSSSYGGAGHTDGGTDVSLGNIGADDNRPILLHEYMHVYHRTRLPGGFRNPAVLRFYEQALSSGAYPQGSYMLKNEKEFFAMTASAYLNGSVARPPYSRDSIRQAQPEYYAYLGHLFGPR